MKEHLKIKIDKPSIKLELESRNPKKHLELIHSLVECLCELNGDIRTVRRNPEVQVEVFERCTDEREGRYSSELLNKPPARAIIESMEKTTEMGRRYNIVADLKRCIDLTKNESRAILDIDSWKNELKKSFSNLKVIKLQTAIIHIIGPKISLDDIKTIEETTTRHLNYPPCETFITTKNLGDKAAVEIILFGEFQQTPDEML